ncbi:hypothetical protein QJS10_CPB15g00841 [Acorus calamus]|uniref:Retrotransposon gag domain-containing protein n=1 Tax=Acorus calamus TaxID=4465 RepID=A0AAV9D7H7_ACOCL|nr:hypothetical protein QJS10_CPB15g00841 [Acorus calamus]
MAGKSALSEVEELNEEGEIDPKRPGQGQRISARSQRQGPGGSGTASIRTFEELETIFDEHFIYNRRRKMDLGDLMKIQMNSGKMIWQYVDRFHILKFKVEDCNEDVVVMAFRNSLSSENGLKESLIKRTPSDLQDLMERAEKYAKVEEESKLLKQAVAAFKSSSACTSPSTKSTRESHPKEPRGEKSRKSGTSTNEVREGQGIYFKIPSSQKLSNI